MQHLNARSPIAGPAIVAVSLAVILSVSATAVRVYASNHVDSGSTWSEITTTRFPSMFNVHLVDRDHAWAVGDAKGDQSGATILHWDGRSWTRMPTPTTSIDLFNASLFAPSDNDVWLGENALHHWNGVSWSEVDTQSLVYRIYELDGVSSKDFWILGITAAAQPVFIHVHDGKLTSYPAPPPPSGERTALYYALDMTSATDGWAVGRDGNIARWDGTSWSRVETPTKAWLYDVDFRTPSDGWAVGSTGTILHWNGNSWSDLSSPVKLSVIAVAAAGDSDVWVAYDASISGANLLGHWNGRSWTQSESPTLRRIEALDVIDGAGFAVAAQAGTSTDMQGALLRLDSR